MAWRLTFGLPLQPYRRGDVRQPTKQSSRREDGVEQARNEGSQEGSTLCRRETKEGPTLHIQSMKGATTITCSCKWAAFYWTSNTLIHSIHTFGMNGRSLINSIHAWILATPFIPNYKTFDFFIVSLTTRLIQKICTNIVKFKSFFKNFLLIKQATAKEVIFCIIF